jgi:hypothetical protein
LRRFSKEEVSSVEEKNLCPFSFDLGDQGGFLGDTTKRAFESATGFNFPHDIVCVDDAELNFGHCLEERDRE